MWESYFDAFDAALRALAIAVADDVDPPWPADLAVPSGPLPAALRARRDAALAAGLAVAQITEAARDAVAAELHAVARHDAGRRASQAALSGGLLDVAG